MGGRGGSGVTRLPSAGVNPQVVAAGAALFGVLIGWITTRSQSRLARLDEYYRETRLLAATFLTSARATRQYINDFSHLHSLVNGKVLPSPEFEQRLAESGQRWQEVFQRSAEFQLMNDDKNLEKLASDIGQMVLQALNLAVCMQARGVAESENRSYKEEFNLYSDSHMNLIHLIDEFQRVAHHQLRSTVRRSSMPRRAAHRVRRIWLHTHGALQQANRRRKSSDRPPLAE